MAIPIVNFQPETFAQTQPVAQGISTSNELLRQALMNKYMQSQNQIAQAQAQYAQPMAQQDLLKSQLNNQILQPQAQYSPQLTMADLALKRAMPNYYNSMASMSSAEANKTNTLLPYDMQKAQGSVFSDPIMSRLYQLSLANKTGAIPSPYLSAAGMPSPASTQNQNMPMPDLNSVINNSQQGGGQPTNPQQILPTNAYGTNPSTAPKAFNGNGFQNWSMFGTPYNPIEYGALQKQADQGATTGVDQWNTANSAAQTDATLGNQLQNFAQQFQNGYKDSKYTGPSLGKVPSSGWETSFVPGNLTPEQITDNASQNAAALVAKLIAGGRVTNYEMQYMNTLKPNRLMTPQAAQMTSDFLIQRAKQMQQLPQFLNAAKNGGVDAPTAQTLWNMYRQQRPVYDFQNRTPNTQFNGSWKDYLNPQAVQAAQSGQNYVPIPKFSDKKSFINWSKTLDASDRAFVQQQISGGGK